MLRSTAEYLAGLNDTREVYFRGERVVSVTQHPELGLAARHAALEFQLSHDPVHRPLAVVEDDNNPYSFDYHIPERSDDLVRRSRLIEASTRQGATLVLLVKEIGTDAITALSRVLARKEDDRVLLERVKQFHVMCRDQDLALAVAQTDVKGSRRVGPAQQTDPDLYVRTVSQDKRGIVVRGAKVHTSCAPYVDWIIVLPGRSMGAGDEEWSVSFAVPLSAPGLKLYASDFLTSDAQPLTQPIASAHRMVETLTVFNDVFIPWEQVFFAGRPDLAGQAALGFVEHHRFTAVSYKLPLLDAIVGAAAAIAQANGISEANHVRDKLAWLVGYAESVRALVEMAARRAHIEGGVAYPDVLTTNLAKWIFARDFHAAVARLQDLAGGLLVTGPSDADLTSETVRPVLEKYLGAAWPADERMSMMNVISELTARAYGGYQAVLALHAEGSTEAEKLALLRAYDFGPAVAYAQELARGEYQGVVAAAGA
jgi:aromatic ring hydroxylase